MTSFSLDLDLKDHCIATELKKRYNKALSDCFKIKDNADALENEIELLKQALETLDFPALRGRHLELAGQCSARVTLGRTDDRLYLTIDSRPVELIYTKSRS